jgi:Protein of unknown function (DUF2585)
MRSTRTIVLIVVAILALTVAAELWMGRLLFGPDGRFGWWEGNIWSAEQSQRLVDAYSFSHVVHGLLFYLLLWLVARPVPVRYRFVTAVAIEAGWEILENSPLIINRYRAVTIALGYVGDSVLNSLSDVLMMSIGFQFASRARPWISVLAALGLELGLALWVRDNLTLNIIMMAFPLDAIRTWQMSGK